MAPRFLRDERASIAALTAMLTPAAVLIGAITVDIGSFNMQGQALQAATDLAAMAAAANPTQPAAAAQQNLALNGFPASTLVSAVVGNYSANSALTPAQRFTAAPGGSAVQISTQTQVPSYFGNILAMMSGSGGANAKTLTARATAVNNVQTAFGVGSGAASLGSGLLNSELGGLLGANVSLTAADYSSLGSANVSLFAMSNNLATDVGLTAGTYNQVLSQSVTKQTLLSALSQTLNQTSGVPLSTVDNVTSLANSAGASTTNVNLGQLVSLGTDGTLGVNSNSPVTASSGALNLLSAIAGLSSGANQATVSLTGTTAPISSATLLVDVGQPPSNSPYVTVGSTGSTVSTAQIRMLLTLQIAQIGSASLLNAPIYLEVGSATAALASTTCPTPSTAVSVSLNVTPGVATAWVGTVTASAMSNFGAEPTVSPATIVNVAPVGAVSASGKASVSNTTPTTVYFSAADIAAANTHTTSTTDYTSSLLSSLFSNLQLTVTVAGVSVPAPTATSSAIGSALTQATPAIDSLLSGLLSNLGAGVGNATTWVSGVNCNATKLAM